MHKALVVENGGANAVDELDRGFNCKAGKCVATEWFAVDIFRPDITEVEAAEVIRAAEEQAVENRDAIPVAPVIDDGRFPVEGENDVVGEKKILLGLHIEAISMNISTEHALCNFYHKGKVMPVQGQINAIARIMERGVISLFRLPLFQDFRDAPGPR